MAAPVTTPNPSYDIRPAMSDDDLRQILALQAANLREHLNEAERREQGFLTLRHDFELLRAMNRPWPHMVASPRGSSEVAAYALVMQREFRDRVPLLEPLFVELERVRYRGRPINDYRSYIMGQVCVGVGHRGRGLVERLYEAQRTQMAPHFDLMITDIDSRNARSLRAHEKAGLEAIHEYTLDTGETWIVVVMDLRAQ